MKLYSIFRQRIFILCALIILSGCASSKVSFLASDNLAKDQGLIVVRVRIKDHTGALVYNHPRMGWICSSIPSLIVQKDGERRTNDEAWIYLANKYEDTIQKKDDGTFYFDQYYYMAAEPGRYFLNFLNLHLNEKWDIVYQGTRTTSTYLNVPLYVAVDVKSNGIACVGLVDFELNSIQTDKRTGQSLYNYTMMLDDSHEQMTQILGHVQNKYPISSHQLSEQSFEKPFFGVYVNFNKYVSASTQHFNRWSENYSKVCSITAQSKDALILDSQEPKKTNFRYATMKDSINLPNCYTINFQMRWYNGMKDAVYGLNIVKDGQSQYLFGVTAEGTPTIWIKKNNQWLADPATKKVSRFFGAQKQADDFKIAYKDGVLTYYINNEVAATIKDVLGIKKTKVGFFVAGKQKVAADFFTIAER